MADLYYTDWIALQPCDLKPERRHIEARIDRPVMPVYTHDCACLCETDGRVSLLSAFKTAEKCLWKSTQITRTEKNVKKKN